MSKKSKPGERLKEVRNAKASFRYHIGERHECGIVLSGTEVKSIRAGKAQIGESFVRIDKGQATLYHAHIDEYSFGNFNNHNPTRPRRLLLHRRELDKLAATLQAGGCTLVPLRMYFKQALVKVEVAICKGKKLFDKREDLKKKDALREAQRAMQAKRV